MNHTQTLPIHTCTLIRTCRLIAPSGPPLDPASVPRALERLRAHGWVVTHIAATQRRFQRFAGTDSERLEELNQLVNLPNPLPDLLLAIRGGYGAVRLLSRLDYEGLKRRFTDQPVAWVGYSDFTAIQMALLAKAGLITFSGPMLCSHFGAETFSDFTFRQFQNIFSAPEITLHCAAAQPYFRSHSIDIKGTLWGGNLAIICSLIGTPYLPRIDGGILFIEDIHEPPFRIERMLYQLYAAGVLARQQALLLGEFTGVKLSEADHGYTLAAAFRQIHSVIPTLPILTGLPLGHGNNTVTLPVGAPAQLTAHAQGFVLRAYHYPFKPQQLSSNSLKKK